MISNHELSLVGDEVVFTKIFCTYRKLVFLEAFHRTKDELVSEDITQEVFISLWTFPRAFENEAQLRGYLRVLARNKAVDYIRRCVVRNKHMKDHIPLTITEIPVFRKDINTTIKKYIDRLTPKALEIFYLFFEFNLSQQQIADLLHINVQSVKNSIYRSTTLLQDQLKFVK